MTDEELTRLAYDAEDSRDYDRFDAALIEVLDAAPDADRVWAVVSLDGVSGAAFGEGLFPAPVIETLVRRALALADAQLLGLVARLASYEPAAVLDDQDWKLPVRAALGAEAPALRAAWDEAGPHLRAQIAHVLVVGEAVEDEDAARIEAFVGSAEGAALALSLAAYGHLARPLDARRALLEQHLDSAEADVRLMAACALGRLEAPLGPSATATLAKALREAHALPTWWAFRTWDRHEDGAELVKRTLHRVKLEDPTEAILALAARDDGGWRESETLQNLAFLDRDPDPLGLVASTLDEAQRKALEAHTRAPMSEVPGALHILGLVNPGDVAPFLAETGPLWSVREVTLADGTSARWSLARIWKAHVWDVVGYDEALRALTEPLDPDALFTLTCTDKRGILLQRKGHQRGAAHHGRDDALSEGCLRALLAHGFDLAGPVHAAYAKGVRNAHRPVALGSLLLAAGGEAFSDAECREIASGVRIGGPDSRVRALLEELEGETKERIAALL